MPASAFLPTAHAFPMPLLRSWMLRMPAPAFLTIAHASPMPPVSLHAFSDDVVVPATSLGCCGCMPSLSYLQPVYCMNTWTLRDSKGFPINPQCRHPSSYGSTVGKDRRKAALVWYGNGWPTRSQKSHSGENGKFAWQTRPGRNGKRQTAVKRRTVTRPPERTPGSPG